MVRILQAEDLRRWDESLGALLSDADPTIRRRTALAAGRIGDEAAVSALSELLARDTDADVKEMAAFALGEIEAVVAAPTLVNILNTSESASLRARAIESLGKIAASLASNQETKKRELNQAILAALKAEARAGATPNRQVILLGLTAALRGRGEGFGPTIAEFLDHSDARVRADASNALARMRLRAGETRLRELLVKDADPIVRANAARALGAAEDKLASDALLDRAIHDTDLRVRVSAIRALGQVRSGQAEQPLLNRGISLSKSNLRNRPSQANEILEIASTLGRVMQGSENQEATEWFKRIRPSFGYAAPELEIAFARISPAAYLQDVGSLLPAKKSAKRPLPEHWKARASVAEGIGEIASLPGTTKDRSLILSNSEVLLRSLLTQRSNALKVTNRISASSEYAVPSILRALAAFKPDDLGETLRQQLSARDVIVRATAADLLGELPAEEANAQALIRALAPALKDVMNDAALSILDSLGKQKTATTNEAIKTALDSSDHLIRRRAVAILKANEVGDFTPRVGLVKSQYTAADYQRALARANKQTLATVTTSKGSFVIEFLPEQAPLTVDNFVSLAQRGYFNGQAIPRVVPNFVIQAGDPRGDQNGGPGYTIRCEINQAPYERAAVGMALSGKDTGGSQWFVTHSPQPHLDGGYTVFGRVISGMEVVDNLVRGDLIRSVSIIERSRNTSRN
jgi:cyclophilin family peptidyl-prolyl cis-trans isomerase/HEAT repeat protein